MCEVRNGCSCAKGWLDLQYRSFKKKKVGFFIRVACSAEGPLKFLYSIGLCPEAIKVPDFVLWLRSALKIRVHLGFYNSGLHTHRVMCIR